MTEPHRNRAWLTPGLIMLYIAVIVSLTAIVTAVAAFNESDVNKDRGNENRTVICPTVDLIAHVPAVQFEGEPLSNFLGWVQARHDLLVSVRDEQVCEAEVIEALERRIRIDERVLERIREEAG